MVFKVIYVAKLLQLTIGNISKYILAVCIVMCFLKFFLSLFKALFSSFITIDIYKNELFGIKWYMVYDEYLIALFFHVNFKIEKLNTKSSDIYISEHM